MLAQVLDPELSKFYRNLLRSEARHFQDYLMLAYETGHAEVDAGSSFSEKWRKTSFSLRMRRFASIAERH